MNNLIQLLQYGQSYWLDNLTRTKITSGELKRRVSEQGLRGITSNPDIFNKAITGSSDYDAQIGALAKTGKSPVEMYDALTIEDIRNACNILLPVYKQSKGADGFVSLEVSPYLAHDAENSVLEAHRLFHAVDRENCMIKLPGTKEGIAAIEQALYEGININITLLFSVERYLEVAQAYIRALERRIAEGKAIDNIHSVASVFISRIDVLVDELLGQKLIPSENNAQQRTIRLLFGKAGIATAQQCYSHFRKLFSGESWMKLEEKGAHVQRPLWASTSTKNPLYDDLMYVDALIGPDTVNTLPDKTIEVFAATGTLKKNAIEENTGNAEQVFHRLEEAGIEMKEVIAQLENEGVHKFILAYNQLIANLAARRMKALENEFSSQSISGGELEKEIKSAYAFVDEQQAVKRLFLKDPFLWTSDERSAEDISGRIDWLDLPELFEEQANDIIAFAEIVKAQGFKDAVLLGMGGSSLCSEVALRCFETAKGFLKLHVLDNTSPEAIRELEKNITLEKTLFLVASKSGSTQETICFFRYFREQLQRAGKKMPGDHFVAITDAGTPLVKIAEEHVFRKTFLNPSGVGGRYSVLSFFGLVPMALMGIDIAAILSRTRQMKNGWPELPSAANPAVSLGVALGICQKHGRDKITFILSPAIRSFGLWVEQLLAESTGKNGRGLIPVNGETSGGPEVYGHDRVFVHMYLTSDDNVQDKIKVKALKEAGHPVIEIAVKGKILLGAEFYRWEVAVAIAGMVMRINPFDQPNVEESKQNTRALLKEWEQEQTKHLPVSAVTIDRIAVYRGKKEEALKFPENVSIGEFVLHFLHETQQDGYVALLPYFLLTDRRAGILNKWREQIRDDQKVATTLLGGPRYLHSTGQLHKGGPPNGTFLLLIGEEENDLVIPGENFSFKTLQLAQAFGDFRSLDNKNRSVILLQLGKNIDESLERIFRSFDEARIHAPADWNKNNSAE